MQHAAGKGLGALKFITPTKSDTVNDPNGPFDGFWCETTGILRFADTYGNDTQITPLAGMLHGVPMLRVFNTTTTAVVKGVQT